MGWHVSALALLCGGATQCYLLGEHYFSSLAFAAVLVVWVVVGMLSRPAARMPGASHWDLVLVLGLLQAASFGGEVVVL